jgi:hypothetical protein
VIPLLALAYRLVRWEPFLPSQPIHSSPAFFLQMQSPSPLFELWSDSSGAGRFLINIVDIYHKLPSVAGSFLALRLWAWGQDRLISSPDGSPSAASEFVIIPEAELKISIYYSDELLWPAPFKFFPEPPLAEFLPETSLGLAASMAGFSLGSTRLLEVRIYICYLSSALHTAEAFLKYNRSTLVISDSSTAVKNLVSRYL